MVETEESQHECVPADSMPMDSQPMDSETMEEPDSQPDQPEPVCTPGDLELEGPTVGEPGPVALGVSPTFGCPSTASTESPSMPPPPVPSKEAMQKKAEMRAQVESRLQQIRPGLLPKNHQRIS